MSRMFPGSLNCLSEREFLLSLAEFLGDAFKTFLKILIQIAQNLKILRAKVFSGVRQRDKIIKHLSRHYY